MDKILIEEHGCYGLDCKNAVWATDEMHDLFHEAKLTNYLSDADFVVETEKYILLVEYKNANIAAAQAHPKAAEFDPNSGKKFNGLIKKFYSSLHYLRLMKKEKPVRYICVLEYPNDNSSARKRLRNRMQEQLPFTLQDLINSGVILIDRVEVLNIEEWNEDELYGKYPIKPVEELGT